MKSDHNDGPNLEIEGKIDFDALKAQVQKRGPLVICMKESTVQIKIDIVSSQRPRHKHHLSTMKPRTGVYGRLAAQTEAIRLDPHPFRDIAAQYPGGQWIKGRSRPVGIGRRFCEPTTSNIRCAGAETP